MHAFVIRPGIDPSINQFIHPSGAAVIPISIHPPSSPRKFRPDLRRFAFVSCSQCRIKLVKVSKKVADFFFLSEEGRTGRFQVSGPIGVRWWQIHLPKHTAQRSRVLHLSQQITPLSRPLVLQHQFQVLTIQNSCQHAMCKIVVLVVMVGGGWG